MAGLFDDFNTAAPPKKKGMFDDFDTGAATPNHAAPASPSPGGTAALPASQQNASPSNQAPDSGILSTLAGGVHKASQFINTAVDTGTFGLSDWLAGHMSSALGGPDTAAMRATTQQGRDELGWAPSMAADVAGYALGPGQIKVGARLASAMGGRWLPRVIGSGIEGAGSAVLGTAGHGDTDPGDLARSGVYGGAIGLGTGMLPGSRPAVKQVPTDAMEQSAKTAWAGPNQMPADPYDVSTALTKAHLNMNSGDRVLMGSELEGAIKKAMRESGGTNSLTAGDVSNFQRAIGKAARNPDDKRIALGFKDALEQTYDPAAGKAIEAARAASNKYKTSGSIDDWLSDPSAAPDKIGLALKKTPQYFQSHPELFERLQAISQMGQPSMIKNLATDVGSRAAKGALTAAVGGIPAGAIAAAVGAPAKAAIDAAPIRRALLAAQHLNNTGTSVPPRAFAPQRPKATALSDFLRRLGYTAGATGAL